MNKSREKELRDYFPAFNKNRDNISLLIAYPEFQQEIKKIRLRLGLTKKENDAPECGQQWMDEMVRKNDEIESDPEFVAQFEQIRERLKKSEIDLKTANKQSKLLYSRLPFNYLSESINTLIKKFHLPINYDTFIRFYITSGKIVTPTSNFAIEHTGLFRDRKNLGCVSVKIFSKLSDEDLKELKKRVNDWFGDFLPKYQELTNISKKIEVAEWYNDRTKYDEATGETYKTSNKEIAENLLGNPKKSRKVYEIIRTVKKTQKNRFGKE